MKVYISNYRDHWLSPYKIAEKLCWWREIDYDEAWVQRLNSVLEPVMSIIQKILDTFHPRVDYVKIDKWDTWNMDRTLASIILPMLKQLKATKQGYPSDLTEKKWNDALDKMIFSFDAATNGYDDDQFWIVKPEIDWDNRVKDDKEHYTVTWITKGKLNKRGLKAYYKKINEGFELFGKHYMSLWD